MGSLFSCTDYGEWESRTECGHSYCDIRMDEVRWIRVPMVNDTARFCTEIFRGILAVGTLGISSAFVKDLSHECIEFQTTCTKCGAKLWFTADMKGLDEGKLGF